MSSRGSLASVDSGSGSPAPNASTSRTKASRRITTVDHDHRTSQSSCRTPPSSTPSSAVTTPPARPPRSPKRPPPRPTRSPERSKVRRATSARNLVAEWSLARALSDQSDLSSSDSDNDSEILSQDDDEHKLAHRASYTSESSAASTSGPPTPHNSTYARLTQSNHLTCDAASSSYDLPNFIHEGIRGVTAHLYGGLGKIAASSQLLIGRGGDVVPSAASPASPSRHSNVRTSRRFRRHRQRNGQRLSSPSGNLATSGSDTDSSERQRAEQQVIGTGKLRRRRSLSVTAQMTRLPPLSMSPRSANGTMGLRGYYSALSAATFSADRNGSTYAVY